MEWRHAHWQGVVQYRRTFGKFLVFCKWDENEKRAWKINCWLTFYTTIPQAGPTVHLRCRSYVITAVDNLESWEGHWFKDQSLLIFLSVVLVRLIRFCSWGWNKLKVLVQLNQQNASAEGYENREVLGLFYGSMIYESCTSFCTGCLIRHKMTKLLSSVSQKMTHKLPYSCPSFV